MSIQDLLHRLSTLEKFHSGVPASTLDVEYIEQSAGVRLPNDYGIFLRHFGYVRWLGQAIYGLHEDDEEISCGYDFGTLRQTTRAREELTAMANIDLPTHGIVIGDDGTGGWYFMYAAPSPKAGEVVYLDHENKWTKRSSWPSFEAFVRHLTNIIA